jgi:hypothetical protein
MRIRIIVLLALCATGVAACGTHDTRDWMKVNQRYTTQEFQRDYRECGRDDKTFEPCMRQRGWVPVTPSKADTQVPDLTPRDRGRY